LKIPYSRFGFYSMSDSLFEEPAASASPEAAAPLAARLAPLELDEFAGQEHILGAGKLLRRAIEADSLQSAVFYGPSGAGKTALAGYISSKTKARTFELNAVTAGVAELKKILEFSKGLSGGFAKKQRILLILDEIHHFNRTQQDVLLPSVEKGEVILIGMTTENPFFYINGALLSRSIVVEFKALDESHLRKILARALSEERGLKNFNVELSAEAADYLVSNSMGDARRLLNALELAVVTTRPDAGGKRSLDLDIARESIQKRSLRYDKSSDEHYDHISAFIKSMRGSDPDAAVYWLARMLQAGEDPRFLARRILICASEDVGNANPMALLVAQSAFKSVEMLGMPESRITLAQAAIYVAVSPKSNASYLAISKAMAEVANGPERPVPMHLRDATKDGEALGHGKGYKYPHDFPNHYVKQEYMPEPKRFYKPTEQGFEAEIGKRLARLKESDNRE